MYYEFVIVMIYATYFFFLVPQVCCLNRVHCLSILSTRRTKFLSYFTQFVRLGTFCSSVISSSSFKGKIKVFLPSVRRRFHNPQSIKIVIPIWDTMHRTEIPTSTYASASLSNVFAIVVSGSKIGSIEVTLLNRESAQPPIKVILSTWRCQQLFPKKVSIAWIENDTRKQLHISAFSLWLKSSNRREIQPEVSVPIQPPSIVADWLRHIICHCHTPMPVLWNSML